jgi:hypothetical protein
MPKKPNLEIMYETRVKRFVAKLSQTENPENVIRYLAAIAISGQPDRWITPDNRKFDKFEHAMLEHGLADRNGEIKDDNKKALIRMFLISEEENSFPVVGRNKTIIIYQEVAHELAIISQASNFIKQNTAKRENEVDHSVDAARFLAALAIKGKVPEGIVAPDILAKFNAITDNMHMTAKGFVNKTNQRYLRSFFENAPDTIETSGLPIVYDEVKKALEQGRNR